VKHPTGLIPPTRQVVDPTRRTISASALADLDLKDALVTADALHTQDAHANFLVNEKHADFFSRLSQFWGRELLSPGPVGRVSLGTSFGL
jgi:hypothetical protein